MITSFILHRWFSGKISRCHPSIGQYRLAPGSIPGRCIFASLMEEAEMMGMLLVAVVVVGETSSNFWRAALVCSGVILACALSSVSKYGGVFHRCLEIETMHGQVVGVGVSVGKECGGGKRGGVSA
jgi:hypothetical protein